MIFVKLADICNIITLSYDSFVFLWVEKLATNFQPNDRPFLTTQPFYPENSFYIVLWADEFMQTPSTYQAFCQYWQSQQFTAITSYTSGNQSFIPSLLPQLAVSMPTPQLIYILEKRLGEQAVRQALNPDYTVESPVAHQPNGTWLKTVNMVGINVRTISSFWNVLKYALTLPAAQSSIHLLPIWECGVVASLYGMASWHINPEFFDGEIVKHYPHLNTVEKQLKVVVNLLHLMGKTVGMDVIPHTDRYSEVSLANPQFFEWLQRKEFVITNHAANLHEKVQERILDFLNENGSVTSEYYPRRKEEFFDNSRFPEETRLRILFGEKADLQARNTRRNLLINHLFAEGYEPVPATMAPPYRGLEVDYREEAKTVDADGRVWRDYVITKPEKMSRVFGPLARYKLYESKNDNADWVLDFDQPRPEVWEYAAKKFAHVAETYHFDFMRGDMSHVQMNPNANYSESSIYYDIQKYIKHHIAQQKPYFGYFAESFLAPDDTMAYGNEAAHLEASDTDSTLGDLQSMVVGSQRFVSEFARYDKFLTNSRFAPNFTVMTADKDDPRFDEFYVKGNELRLFMALFLTGMPSYMGLGFEVRDTHLTPAPNEHYTKLYVFQLDEGPKATHTPYHWGQNGELFAHITDLKKVADSILPQIENQAMQWLIEPDLAGERKVIAWTQSQNSQYIFVANMDIEQGIQNISLNFLQNYHKLFSSLSGLYEDKSNVVEISLEVGECLIFERGLI